MWRDFVAEQLTESGRAQTIEVFAKRMKRPPSDFESLLQSPDQMTERVFRLISNEALAQFRQRAFFRSRELVTQYLSS
jgi:hypothetical protein